MKENKKLQKQKNIQDNAQDNIQENIQKNLEKNKKRAKKIFNDYKSFALKSNALSLAMGLIIGTAFTNIVKTFVSNFINPIISLLTNNVDINKMFIALDGKHYESLEVANNSGAIIINYGTLIDAILNFLILSIILYILYKYTNKLTKNESEAKVKTTKKCNYCKSIIDIEATKCPFCTSDLTNTNKLKKEKIQKEETEK